MVRVVRTTIDLPEDLHHRLRSLARDRGTTFSATVVDLLREELAGGGDAEDGRLHFAGVDPKTGFPIVAGGRVITTEDVRSLEDEW